MAMRRAAICVAVAVMLGGWLGSAQAIEIVVDNSDAEAIFTGTWPTSAHFPGHIGPDYQHSNKVSDLTATYTPTLDAGWYRVEAHYSGNQDRGDDVPYTITHADGQTVVNRDQRHVPWSWHSLGDYRFDTGTGGSVQISSTVSNGQFVIADAMRWLSVPDPTQSTELSPVADAYIQQNTPTSNFGNDPQLRVKFESPTAQFNRKSYLRFDLGSLVFDPQSELAQAALRLNFIDSGAGTFNDAAQVYEFEVYGLLDGDPGENWAEKSGDPGVPITWENAPANDTTSGTDMLGNAVSLGTFEVLGKGIDEVLFTSQELADFIAASADDMVTLMIARNTAQPNGSNTYIHAIASKENPGVAGPSLVLERAVIPEPCTLSLAGLGGLALAAWRRRSRR